MYVCTHLLPLSHCLVNGQLQSLLQADPALQERLLQRQGEWAAGLEGTFTHLGRGGEGREGEGGKEGRGGEGRGEEGEGWEGRQGRGEEGRGEEGERGGEAGEGKGKGGEEGRGR